MPESLVRRLDFGGDPRVRPTHEVIVPLPTRPHP